MNCKSTELLHAARLERDMTTTAARSRTDVSRRRRARRTAVIAGVVVCFEAIAVRLRSGRFGGNVVVRCRDGHLFTTIWIPGASLKALRLGWLRFQRCPVGGHWSVVTPVRESELTDEQRESAAGVRDVRIP